MNNQAAPGINEEFRGPSLLVCRAATLYADDHPVDSEENRPASVNSGPVISSSTTKEQTYSW